MICMQGWADRSDSLARSCQDWSHRLPIRPDTLPMELNIVCFFPVVVLHRSAVTDTEAMQEGQGSRAGRAAAVLFTDCCHIEKTGLIQAGCLITCW